jgi:uncharacterized repeat protein (TIGR03803 family)
MTQGKLMLGLGRIAVAVVLLLSPVRDAWAGTEKVLYAFTGGSDGGRPLAGLIFDKAGNLYGTTADGGLYGSGTIFKLKRTLNGWQEEVLYSFAGGNDGAYPTDGLIIDDAGRFYGTTFLGGGKGCGGYGCGTVFKLTRASNGVWKENILHSFSKFEEGQFPQAGVVLDGDGNLYGTTTEGGTGVCDPGCGVVFRLSRTPTGKWRELVLYSPKASGNFIAGLVMDKRGRLYGSNYGCDGCGDPQVFRLARSKRSWTVTVLHDGLPNSDLILDGTGNLYGTTDYGGINNCFSFGCGTAVELAPGSRTETVLYAFEGGLDGAEPEAGLAFDNAGSLYGTTLAGGGVVGAAPTLPTVAAPSSS